MRPEGKADLASEGAHDKRHVLVRTANTFAR